MLAVHSTYPITARWARRLRLALPAGCLFAAAAWSQALPASSPASGAMRHEHASHGQADCASTALACAGAATPFFDSKGRLWLAWSAAGAVSVARSTDAGRSFGTPVLIGQHGALLDVGADARPQIVVDAKGRVIVAYGVFKDRNYNAQVMVSTSADDGATFSAPRSLSQDAASQRFPALLPDAEGRLFAAWLDKRSVAAAKKQGANQAGAAVAYAWSADGGLTFSAERLAQDHSCECCRLGLAADGQGRPVVLFRNIYGKNERDHAVLTFSASGEPGPAQRVAADHWEIDGCPHHGPSVAVAGDGSYLAAWFTLGEARQGLFYARSADAGRTFSAPLSIGDAERQAGRPYLLARGHSVWLAWKEFDGQRISIKARRSDDDGRSWSADRVLADTGAYADHPLLVSDGRRVYLSWMTRGEGYRLISVDEP